MERPKYTFEQQSKDERKAEIKKTGILDTHRFRVTDKPNKPEIAERFADFRKAFEDFQKEYPEVVSFGFLGSMVEGYAGIDSDVEGIIFVDASKMPLISDINFDENQTHIGVDTHYTNELRDFLAMRFPNVASYKYHFETVIIEKNDLKTMARHTPMALKNLFLLTIGTKDIVPFRKIVIDEFKKMGKEGEEKWLELMKDLHRFERGGGKGPHTLPANLKDSKTFEELAFYPKTLEKAEEWFLKGAKDDSWFKKFLNYWKQK